MSTTQIAATIPAAIVVLAAAQVKAVKALIVDKVDTIDHGKNGIFRVRKAYVNKNRLPVTKFVDDLTKALAAAGYTLTLDECSDTWNTTIKGGETTVESFFKASFSVVAPVVVAAPVDATPADTTQAASDSTATADTDATDSSDAAPIADAGSDNVVQMFGDAQADAATGDQAPVVDAVANDADGAISQAAE